MLNPLGVGKTVAVRQIGLDETCDSTAGDQREDAGLVMARAMQTAISLIASQTPNQQSPRLDPSLQAFDRLQSAAREAQATLKDYERGRQTAPSPPARHEEERARHGGSPHFDWQHARGGRGRGGRDHGRGQQRDRHDSTDTRHLDRLAAGAYAERPQERVTHPSSPDDPRLQNEPESRVLRSRLRAAWTQMSTRSNPRCAWHVKGKNKSGSMLPIT